MFKPAAELRGTRRVYAARRDFAFKTRNSAAADWTRRRHCKNDFRACALFGNRRFYCRNYIARLYEPYVVANANVLTRNLVGIVQGRAGDYRACERNRLQFRNRRKDARSTNLNGNRLDSRFCALGRVLVCARPTRTVGSRAEDIVELALVDLDDGAVDR